MHHGACDASANYGTTPASDARLANQERSPLCAKHARKTFKPQRRKVGRTRITCKVDFTSAEFRVVGQIRCRGEAKGATSTMTSRLNGCYHQQMQSKVNLHRPHHADTAGTAGLPSLNRDHDPEVQSLHDQAHGIRLPVARLHLSLGLRR